MNAFPQEFPPAHQKALFELLFEHSPDAILVSDSNGRIIHVNGQVERTFGYSREELLGKPIEILIPERFRGGHPAHRDAYTSHASMRPMGAGLELYGLRKDGTEIPVDIMLSPVETPDGKVVLSVIRDITERKKTQEALRLTEQRFQLLVENIRDYAIFRMDPDGRVISWNAGAERLKGYSAEDIIGRSFACFYAPEDVARGIPEESLRVAVARGRFEAEGWRVRKDGTQFWANTVITSIKDRDGNLVGFAKVTRDITERMKADELLRHSEEKLRTLFEYSPDAIITSDSAGRIQDMNAQVKKFFGYTKEELRGQSIDILVPERFRATHPGHRKDYSDRARVRTMGAGLALYARRKDGSEFPVDIVLGPVETGEGRIVLSVIRDLTEKREAEEAFQRIEREKSYLQEELNTESRFEDIIGESVSLKRVLKHVETVASTDVTVLILGETGTGKELIARAIHQLGSRRERTLVKLNCAAIPTGLLESELFGHEKGAFTGAISRKIGRLELAHEGTLFLDEIGDLPLDLQPKILRALQEKEFERLGSTRTIPINVRLVAATNRDLAKMVENREFRSDLYYRLRVFPITIPPLRERREDIPLLVRYFVDKFARRMDRAIETIPKDAMRLLTQWSWPGNIRELENFIERAVLLSKGPALSIPLAELEVHDAPVSGDDTTLESTEREHILKVLREAKGKISGQTGAAERLGLKRTTLNSKMKKLGIERSDYA
jgi:formate hydrogenlyase transcriptional activator